jgi:hypothetical protein
MGELRSLYGWPAPDEPAGSRDDELAERELIAERLGDEWMRTLAGPAQARRASAGDQPAPEGDHPERSNIVVDLGRVRRECRDVRAERRRRRLAESPLAFLAHGRGFGGGTEQELALSGRGQSSISNASIAACRSAAEGRL